MIKLNSAEQKQVIFEILSQFAIYCDKHHLKYYLYYGTLLGAVRHHGFIPWDDDIDVVMMRNDYQKLRSLLATEPINKHYQLLTFEDHNTANPYAKIVDLNTCVKNKNSLADKHLWIDIFPLDYLPEDKLLSEKAIKKTAHLLLLQNAANAKIFSGSSILRAIIKLPFALYAHFKGADYFAQKMIVNAQKYPASTKLANLVAGDQHESAISLTDLINYVDLEFNGQLFHTVNNYKKYLAHQYGDYLKLPPLNKRSGHHIEAYKINKI